MSFDVKGAESFIGPLRGKTATFLVDRRETNLYLAKSAISSAALAGGGCTILDLDAFYSSNSDKIFSGLPASAAKSAMIRVPPPESSIDDELPKLFASEASLILVDSLNTLHHLVSFNDGSSRGRKLALMVAALSFFARTNGRVVVFTMYRRERLFRARGGRQISDLSDTTVSVELRWPELLLKCERGTAWPGGKYSIRIP